ncbi:MAG: Fe-S cluster assembly protein SufD [Anaerolineae bacterium]|nr:MAG: Fe-S cluster assembly protein SufD [Anaerolineae bacterium]
MSTDPKLKRKRIVRRSTAPEFQFSFEEVAKASEGLNEPGWLRERRESAWEVWESLPLPTVKDEPWRRTDLRNIPADRFVARPSDNGRVDQEYRRRGPSLLLHPGHDSILDNLNQIGDQRVVLADWATAVREHEELLRKHLGSVVPDDEGKFSALAAALATDGVLVYIPTGVHLEVPLHSTLWAPGSDLAVLSRVLIVVEDDASATVVHEMASPGGDEASLHSGIVEVAVGRGAQLTFVEIQNWGDRVWNFTHERARVGRDGRMDWIFGAVGSHLTKNFSELTLDGQGAQGRWTGFYFADGIQHLDHDTQQNHLAPNTTSDLLFKGALVDRSRSVWQGMIYVAPGAQRTDGFQANRNLILSKRARADSIPGLEILADDVRCTHGATVSQLEEEPIFYLMSRGIPREEAERLVVEGFFASVMKRIPLESVRDQFEKMIDRKLGHRV